jgi:hypothetical protein
MFDLSFPALSIPFPADVMPVVAHSTFDPALALLRKCDVGFTV